MRKKIAMGFVEDFIYFYKNNNPDDEFFSSHKNAHYNIYTGWFTPSNIAPIEEKPYTKIYWKDIAVNDNELKDNYKSILFPTVFSIGDRIERNFIKKETAEKNGKIIYTFADSDNFTYIWETSSTKPQSIFHARATIKNIINDKTFIITNAREVK